MNQIELVVRLIIKRSDKILLCKMKKQGHYFLPGGHVEFGDSLIDTVFKELQEETGLTKNQVTDIQYKDFLENIYNDGVSQRHEINFIFNVSIPSDLDIKSQENHIDFEWVEMNEISNINFLPQEMISKL